jgi:Uma2 family endonuclease
MQHARGLDEITVPETKPATEWILGEPAQKVSPKRRHALIQGAMSDMLRRWARGRGDCGPEWRFRIAPPGEPARPLVPDLAFLSNERKAGLSGEDLEVPRVAPDIVVEILSPDDRPDRVASKRDVYLAAGTQLVIIVDPSARSLEAYEAGGRTVCLEPSTFSTDRFPGLAIDLVELFREIDGSG